MTAGFLTRLAERARGGGSPALVRPDLPPAYAPGLLAQARPADFEGTGLGETWPGADPAGPDAPEGGARPAGPGWDLGPPRDAEEFPPPATAGPGRVPDRAEPAGARGTGSPEPEAWPRPAARAGRGPGGTPADAAPARYPQPSESFDAAGAAPGHPDDPAASRAGPDELAAVSPSQRFLARIRRDDPVTAWSRTDQPDAAPARAEPRGSRRSTVVPATGTAGPTWQAARPAQPGPREPDVHISIGRIEVRLQEAAAPAPSKTQRRPPADPAVPLEEYLRRRSGTSR